VSSTARASKVLILLPILLLEAFCTYISRGCEILSSVTVSISNFFPFSLFPYPRMGTSTMAMYLVISKLQCHNIQPNRSAVGCYSPSCALQASFAYTLKVQAAYF
jgi:hypothetical protein